MKNVILKKQRRKIFEFSLFISKFLSVIYYKSVRWSAEPKMFEPLKIEPKLVDIVRTVHAERQPPPPKPVIPVMSFDENLLGDETIDATGFLDTLIPYIPKKKEIPEITTCPELDTFIPYDEPPSLIAAWRL